MNIPIKYDYLCPKDSWYLIKGVAMKKKVEQDVGCIELGKVSNGYKVTLFSGTGYIENGANTIIEQFVYESIEAAVLAILKLEKDDHRLRDAYKGDK